MSSWRKSYPSITAIGHNKKRHQSLYSPFQSKTRNPDLYEEKRKFWIKAIEEFSTIERRLIFSIGDLQHAFQTDEEVPTCLPEVVNYLRRRRTLVCEDDYILSLKSKNTSLWLSDVWNSPIFSWLSFVSNFVASYIPYEFHPLKAITKDTRLVFLPQLQLRISFIQSSNLINQVITLEELKQKIAYPDEAELVLNALRYSKHLASDILGDTDIVKVLESNLNHIGLIPATDGLTCELGGITQMEKIKFDILRTKSKVQRIVGELGLKLEDFNKHVLSGINLQRGIGMKHRVIEKNYLEKQSQFFKTLYDNLCELLLQIEESKSEVEAWELYQSGKLATKDYMCENNIIVNCVPDVFWAFVEILQLHLDKPIFGALESANGSLLSDLAEMEEADTSNSETLDSTVQDCDRDTVNTGSNLSDDVMNEPGTSSGLISSTQEASGENRRRKVTNKLALANKENIPPRSSAVHNSMNN